MPDRPDRVFPRRGRLLGTALVLMLAVAPLVVAVLGGWTATLDERLVLAMRGEGPDFAPRGPVWFREAVRDVTGLGSAVVMTAAVVAATGYLLAARRSALAGVMLVSAIGATALSTALKIAIDRSRPDIVPHGMTTTSASFPSGHALLSAAIILSIGGLMAFAARQRLERLVIVGTAMIATLAVGTSRVYLGVHWPSDVLAGWLIGSAWACLTLVVARLADVPGRPLRAPEQASGDERRDGATDVPTGSAVASSPARRSSQASRSAGDSAASGYRPNS